MSLDQLQAACTTAYAQSITNHVSRMNLDIGSIGQIIAVIQQYGVLAERLLAEILPLLPDGGKLKDVLEKIIGLLQLVTGS